MRSVTVHCPHKVSAALLVCHRVFKCGTGSMLQLSITSPRETTLKTDFFHSCVAGSEPVPSTSAEPVDKRPSAQENKQTAINPSAKENRRL